MPTRYLALAGKPLIIIRGRQVCVQESVQAGEERKAAAEDQSSRVTFEVEVLHFQAYLQAELAPGRFLLAAQKGRVEGRSMAHLMQNLITLTLDQVRTACFCACSFCSALFVHLFEWTNWTVSVDQTVGNLFQVEEQSVNRSSTQRCLVNCTVK